MATYSDKPRRPAREKFEAAQQAYREASHAEDEFEITLGAKYGRRNVQWASTAEKRKLEQIRNRRDRACDRVFKMVQGAPRDWGTGVPVHWVCGSLSYDDAFRPTSDTLSVTPPLAYGASEPMRDNPRECSECLEANPVGGAGTALIVGGVVALAYFLFLRPARAAKAAASPATCSIDPAKLDRWGEARGFPIDLLPRATPPTLEEFLASDLASRIAAGEQAVVVLQDGSFWYYIKEPPSTGRADNLRADYCGFPDVPPPEIAPPNPEGTTSGIGVGQGQEPPRNTWTYTALQLLVWSTSARTWTLVWSQTAPYPPGNLAVATGRVADDFEFIANINPANFMRNWIAALRWVWASPPYTSPGWHLVDVSVEEPSTPSPGSGAYGE